MSRRRELARRASAVALAVEHARARPSHGTFAVAGHRVALAWSGHARRGVGREPRCAYRDQGSSSWHPGSHEDPAASGPDVAELPARVHMGGQLEARRGPPSDPQTEPREASSAGSAPSRLGAPFATGKWRTRLHDERPADARGEPLIRAAGNAFSGAGPLQAV
jgi:hypothetical protein